MVPFNVNFDAIHNSNPTTSDIREVCWRHKVQACVKMSRKRYNHNYAEMRNFFYSERHVRWIFCVPWQQRINLGLGSYSLQRRANRCGWSLWRVDGNLHVSSRWLLLLQSVSVQWRAWHSYNCIYIPVHILLRFTLQLVLHLDEFCYIFTAIVSIQLHTHESVKRVGTDNVGTAGA